MKKRILPILLVGLVLLLAVTAAAGIAFREKPILSGEEDAELVFVHVNAGFPDPNSVPEERDFDQRQAKEILSILRSGTEKRTLQRADSFSLSDAEYRILVHLRSSNRLKEIRLGRINDASLDDGHWLHAIQNGEELIRQLEEVMPPR